MARVRDYMQTNFQYIGETAPLLDALEMMGKHQFTHLVILRGGVQIAGIITRSDIISLYNTILLKDGIVRDVVGNQTLIAVMRQDYMEDARSKFEHAPHVDQLVVLELLTPVGVLTKDDMLRWIYEQEFPNPVVG
ncbi:MAG: CBS domain-containing protein [Chloroflexi bacterium]|nr:CBS domain-containing protein [Chloroflexota bacterium]MCC6892716.1 CBS domain-containing protein [Anaerolineae bacterium]